MSTTTTEAENNKGVAGSWNQKNPGVRRILADVRELARDPSDQYAAKPVEENMFEWHFAIRGPKGTDFEGGRYHGKILLPAEYPFKPPNIIFLTPNGRWETKTKICLSMSAYHPEDWQPAWGIRTMLEALISFMPSPSDGALGAMDCTSETRKRLAIESQAYTHPLMPQLPELGSCTYTRSKEFEQAVSQMHFSAKKEENETNKDETNKDEKPVEEEEEKSTTPAAATTLMEETTNVPIVPIVTTTTTTTQQPADISPDRVDDFLRVASWSILFVIFAMIYRKMLLIFAPEL